MKSAYWSVCLLSLGLLGGCVSKVVTYNTTGHVIGSCTAKAGIFFPGKAQCYGYSNLEGLSFSKPQLVSAYGLTAPKAAVIHSPAQTVVAPSTLAITPTTVTTPRVSPVIPPQRQALPELSKHSRITLLPNQDALAELVPQQQIKLFNETPILD